MDLSSKNKDQSSSMRSAKRQTRGSENSCGAIQQNKKSSGRCLNPGPVGRNPYLNFLREFRKTNCGLSAKETIREGAKAWNVLSREQKLKYIEEAFYAPKLRRRRRSRSKSMSAAFRPRRSKSRSITRKSRRRMASISQSRRARQGKRSQRARSKRRGAISC